MFAGNTSLALDDSTTLNESLNSTRGKRRRTLDDYEFVLNENSRFKTSDLGKGSYGTVKKAREKHTGKIYAIKIMNKKSIFEYSNKENLKREISIQKGISHPHIVRLYTYFEDSENVYLVLEFAENGSLFHYLKKRKRVSEKEAFVYFFQTCLGIDYLHKRNVIHRDLKPENLLLDGEGNIKLCDFGWSADTSTKRVTFCGTVDYMAPEMLKNHPYDHRLDIWCLGILLFEILHGDAPFKGRSDQEKCSNIASNAKISFDPTLSSDAVDLIKKILQPSPANRISMLGIFQHPWMKSFQKVFSMDIMSYVRQQDEQIREMKRLEEKKVLPQSLLDSQGEIADQVSPLLTKQKSNHKKMSFNGSTKESEGSTGSEKNSPGLDHYLNEYTLNKRDRDLRNQVEQEQPRKHSKGYESNYLKEYYRTEKKQDLQAWQKSKSFEVNHEIAVLMNKKFLNNDMYGEYDDFLENQRLSRVSNRNIEMPNKSPTAAKDKKEIGFIENLLIGLGCLSKRPEKGV